MVKNILFPLRELWPNVRKVQAQIRMKILVPYKDANKRNFIRTSFPKSHFRQYSKMFAPVNWFHDGATHSNSAEPTADDDESFVRMLRETSITCYRACVDWIRIECHGKYTRHWSHFFNVLHADDWIRCDSKQSCNWILKNEYNRNDSHFSIDCLSLWSPFVCLYMTLIMHKFDNYNSLNADWFWMHLPIVKTRGATIISHPFIGSIVGRDWWIWTIMCVRLIWIDLFLCMTMNPNHRWNAKKQRLLSWVAVIAYKICHSRTRQSKEITLLMCR